MLCSLRYTATHSNLVKSHVVSVWKAVAALSLNKIHDQNWKTFFSIYLTLLLFLWKKYKLTASRNQVQFQFCVAKLGSLSRFVSHAIWTLLADGRLTALIVFLSLFLFPPFLKMAQAVEKHKPGCSYIIKMYRNKRK